MKYEVKMFGADCDNCGDFFEHWHEGWTAFVDEDALNERLDEQGWYHRGEDPDHQEKVYCDNCFKQDDDIDDKIHVDLTRTKNNTTLGLSVPGEKM